MNEMNSSIGKWLIFAGGLLVVAGVVFLFANRIPWLGKLPGDIFFRKGNLSFYFPIVTSIMLSVVLSLIFYFINKFRH